jgi:hypothetical protein
VQAFEFDLGVDDLALWRGVALDELADATQARIGDRDLLLDLARSLRNGGAVGGGNRRLDQRQDVALSDLLPEGEAVPSLGRSPDLR